MRFLLLLCVSAFYLFADAHILIYHRFNDDRYPSANTANSELKEQFAYLRDNNYTVVPLKAISDKLNANETIPDKWIAITIDDGYKSFLNALEIFKEFGYPFSIFVYVQATEQKYSDFMTWEELKGLKEFNGSLEFHSYAHPHSTKLDKESLEKDFEKGLRIFENKTGHMPDFYSYPYGEFNENIKDVAKGFGFSAIFNQNNGAVNDISDIYDLNRLAVVGKVDFKTLLAFEVLQAEWKEPNSFPKDGNLTKVSAKITSNATKAKLYITNIGWKDIKVKDGIVDENIGQKLTNQRTRIILKTGNKTSTKIIVKD
ncbi:MAG: polysaccharide deacetylase family protein [Campylobacteraceae bacterium]|jgi:peptidoglycan/xylan/chitin deacetylase (PgdA/CDA1 family)|nr:polysaccharide deacetylase family protein [Campylobacteraceae bacterium]